jgi:hypothetical protein
MPTRTTRLKSRTAGLDRDRELEALGLGIAPGLTGDDRSEFVKRAEIGAGQPRRGALAADPPALPGELIDDAVGRASDRRRVHAALGMPPDRRISNEMIDELLAGASTEEEIAGPGGLLAELTKRLVERAMEVELTDHVGYEPHQEPPGGSGTGGVRDDPTNATTFTDLNSPALTQNTCPGVRLLRETEPFSSPWGSLISYGRFALAIGSDSQDNGAAFLERCGSGTRELLASGPSEWWVPPLASNSRAIVWLAAPYRLAGLFLPSLQRFTIPLPSAIVTAQGSPVASDTRVAAIGLTSGALYVLDTLGGTLWRTASPTALPLNTKRPTLTRSRSGLICRRGNWRSASRFSYAWRVNGVAKKGANKPRLALGKALKRLSVSCSVTASNRAGTTTASSAQLHARTTAAH